MKKKTEDEYYLDRVIHDPGWIINVYRPILTEEERSRRMKEIEHAAATLIINTEKRKAERKLSNKVKGEKKNE